MAGKYAKIDFNRCAPVVCDKSAGACVAASACTHRLLEQEDAFETPMLMSVTMCVGCGDCVRSCPVGAIEIARN